MQRQSERLILCGLMQTVLDASPVASRKLGTHRSIRLTKANCAFLSNVVNKSLEGIYLPQRGPTAFDLRAVYKTVTTCWPIPAT